MSPSKLDDETRKAYEEATKKNFDQAVRERDVKAFGVCGIDLSQPGELAKVALAIRAGKKQQR